MALIMRRPRADVVALSYCRLLMLRRDAFRAFLRSHPELMQQVRKLGRGAPQPQPPWRTSPSPREPSAFHVKHRLLADAELAKIRSRTSSTPTAR